MTEGGCRRHRWSGLTLTERQGRRGALTPAGEVLAQHGHDVGDLIRVAGAHAESVFR
jgi:hypothetical protein